MIFFYFRPPKTRAIPAVATTKTDPVERSQRAFGTLFLQPSTAIFSAPFSFIRFFSAPSPLLIRYKRRKNNSDATRC